MGSRVVVPTGDVEIILEDDAGDAAERVKRAASSYTSRVDLVRDAMLADPLALGDDRSARDAGEALARPDVRAVFVCDPVGRLVGVVTRKTLVREVVAAGLDPSATKLGQIAEPPNATIESTMPLADAFAYVEEEDFERVPVVEDGRLVGVLARVVVQRRLAEDDPPDDAA